MSFRLMVDDATSTGLENEFTNQNSASTNISILSKPPVKWVIFDVREFSDHDHQLKEVQEMLEKMTLKATLKNKPR